MRLEIWPQCQNLQTISFLLPSFCHSNLLKPAILFAASLFLASPCNLLHSPISGLLRVRWRSLHQGLLLRECLLDPASANSTLASRLSQAHLWRGVDKLNPITQFGISCTHQNASANRALNLLYD